jgi:hypothetical protein
MQWTICFTILFTIFLAAHPYGPWSRVAHRLWYPLAFFQIDVSMTPYTPDMAMMEGVSLYGSRIQPFWRDRSGRFHEISWTMAALHTYRLPLLLGIEQRLSGYPTHGHDYALCRSVARLVGSEPLSFGGTIENLKESRKEILWEETPCPPPI